MDRSNFWSSFFILAILIANSAVSAKALKSQRANIPNCDQILPAEVITEIASYKDDVEDIMNYFKGEFKGQTWQQIADFVDKFGYRFTGSQTLEESIDYMIKKSEDESLRIRTEDVTVTLWLRGDESATLVSPREKNMPMLGLGFSKSTPAGGITAKAIVVSSFEELDQIPQADVEGKIVVYDQQFTTYYETVAYRREGADRAAAKGAVAALVRSITQFSIASPHTGTQNYKNADKQIPVAAITLEDADFLRREQERNVEITIHLVMPATEETKTSRNMIADLEGTTKKEEIVIISGHIDSWDLGDGTMDDAGGCFISWLAPIALKKLEKVPKRTLRALLFTSEEQGLHGAIEHKKVNEVEYEQNLAFLMESDFGTFAPLGLSYEGSEEGQCVMQEILKMFTSINATEIVLESPAPDIGTWTSVGYPGAGLHNANDRYFWFHHSEGDTLNVLDPDTMDVNGGFWTSVAYIISDMNYRIPRVPQTP